MDILIPTQYLHLTHKNYHIDQDYLPLKYYDKEEGQISSTRIRGALDY